MTQKAFPWIPHQEGAAVYALALGHAILELEMGVSDFSGAVGRSKRHAGRVPGAAAAPINLPTGSSSRLICGMHTKNSGRSFALNFSPPRWLGGRLI